jgi:predicted dinucleotide-binding enzyme
MSSTNSGNREVVGIIGAGRLGTAMAQTALRAGRSVLIANSRGPESLGSLVGNLGDGAAAGSVQDAARAGVVVLAVPWDDIADATRQIDWSGQVLIDATNDFDPAGLDGRGSSEVVADLAGGARVVKAFNTLAASVLGEDPHQAGGRRVLFVSGDDDDAKHAVAQLLDDAGFFVIDLGSLADGGRMQQVGGPLPSHDLIRLAE